MTDHRTRYAGIASHYYLAGFPAGGTLYELSVCRCKFYHINAAEAIPDTAADSAAYA